MYRQTRVLGVLLLLQVVAMVGIGVWLFDSVDWDRVLTLANEQGRVRAQTIDGPWLKPLERAMVFAVYFSPPAILLLLAGLGLVLLRRRGWMLASVAQALIMLACLFFYGESRPGFAYFFIAYSILMILYLNSQGVRAVVHSGPITPSGGRSETARGG
ncbi:hypothetical protein AVDCRST_MAG82-1861 [uncultured Rubrobacteraceae bacterium]|uniref:Uncharacterized protein n=1 Tax=uncultured Rubrobacteraceae bacterium TaxID=349277 RepID=A0A6J4PW42_9ACTN|nr:hypothetical protein AVDCRST_MAG82-1861 [uncultured Rubrobacteraceae bacterium]